MIMTIIRLAMATTRRRSVAAIPRKVAMTWPNKWGPYLKVLVMILMMMMITTNYKNLCLWSVLWWYFWWCWYLYDIDDIEQIPSSHPRKKCNKKPKKKCHEVPEQVAKNFSLWYSPCDTIQTMLQTCHRCDPMRIMRYHRCQRRSASTCPRQSAPMSQSRILYQSHSRNVGRWKINDDMYDDAHDMW